MSASLQRVRRRGEIRQAVSGAESSGGCRNARSDGEMCCHRPLASYVDDLRFAFSFWKPLEIFACVVGSLALRTMSFSSFFAFGDFAAFSILFMRFPIAPQPFFRTNSRR